MNVKQMLTGAALAAVASTAFHAGTAGAQSGIDNGALSSPTFREHKRTFGLVYTLPKEVNDTLNATVYGLLREKLLNAKLYDEAQRLNIPHVTVLHIHNPDPTTPEKMKYCSARQSQASGGTNSSTAVQRPNTPTATLIQKPA